MIFLPEHLSTEINPHRSFRIVTRRIALNVVEWGPPDAPPLLLVHGGLDQCRSWDWTALALSERWRIIAPDLRGHGDSDWSTDGHYNLQAYLHDIAEVVEQLAIARLSIVGHSMGGAIALRYAGVFPERVAALVAIEGVGLPPNTDRLRDKKPIAEVLCKWMNDTREAEQRGTYSMATLYEAEALMRAMNRSLSSDLAHYLARHATRRTPDGRLRWKFDHLARVRSPIDLISADIHELWSRIECPVLLINGRDSWAGNPADDGRIEHFKDARSVEFANAGHWVHHDRFPDFIEKISEFLSQ